jgi:hypothetical protein
MPTAVSPTATGSVVANAIVDIDSTIAIAIAATGDAAAEQQ